MAHKLNFFKDILKIESFLGIILFNHFTIIDP